MTTTKTQFHVSSRALEEKNSQLRHTGYIPANIYGLNKDSVTISLVTKPFMHHLNNEGETGLMYLVADESSVEQPVLITEVQRNPVTGEVLHVSFMRVNLAQKIVQEIDLKLTGEFDLKEATVLLVRNTVEIEALPADLPEAFYIDISKLTEIGQEVHVSDLDYDRAKITLQMTEEEQAEPIALVQEVKEEVVEEPVEAEGATDEAGADAPAAEGDAPAADAENSDE